MRLRVGDLIAVANQVLYCIGKQGEYALIADGDQITALGCDNYTAVYDTATGDGEPVGATGATSEVLGRLTAAGRAAHDLKTDPKYVTVSAKNGGMLFAFPDEEVHVPYRPTMAEAMVDQILEWESLPPREGSFHIHPERLARLGRLKGGAAAMPLSFKVIDNPSPAPGRPPATLLFRIGGTCRGAIAAIDGDILARYLACEGEDEQGVLF